MRFTLGTTPTAQQRARHTKTGRAYKSTEQQANERTLEAMLVEYQPVEPLQGALVLEFVAVMPMPKSVSKRDRQAMRVGEILPTKKPDLDNLAKQLKDAMTRMQFWGDDRQVVELRCRKIYGETGLWSVCVRRA